VFRFSCRVFRFGCKIEQQLDKISIYSSTYTVGRLPTYKSFESCINEFKFSLQMQYLDTYPKNDVILFPRKRFCALLGLGLRFGLVRETRLNTFSVKRPFGQVYKPTNAYQVSMLTSACCIFLTKRSIWNKCRSLSSGIY